MLSWAISTPRIKPWKINFLSLYPAHTVESRHPSEGMHSRMEREILKADKQYRTRLLTAYLVGIAVFSLCLCFGLPRYCAYLRTLKIPDMLDITEISTMIFFACFIGPACYLMVVGRRIIFSKRFPFPGQKVIRDTKIIEGKKAVRRGRMLFILGMLTIIILIAGAARSHYFFEKLRNFNPFQSYKRLA